MRKQGRCKKSHSNKELGKQPKDMETKKIESPMREYLSSLKVRGHNILSEDTMDYLTEDGAKCAVYEFKQEGESDHEFLRQFSTWLHELPHVGGHVEYYLLMGMRMGERLSEDEFEFLERSVADCFSYSHGWYYEMNHRRRYRLRITLIMSQKTKFRRLIKKTLPGV